MSGVIDGKGVQWEHCTACGDWVELDKLYYEPRSEKYKYGRDLCPECWKKREVVMKKKYQVIAISCETKDIGAGRISSKMGQVNIGGPVTNKVEADTHAKELQDAMHKLGRTEISVTVIEVDVA